MPDTKTLLKINLNQFYLLYDKLLVLKWVLSHLSFFESEIETLLNNISKNLNMISKKADLHLDSIEDQSIIISYSKDTPNNKIFTKHFVQKFSKEFVSFLKQCEEQCQYLSKQITCKQCKSVYTLLSTSIIDDNIVICPVCSYETILDIDGNALLNIENIFNILTT